MESYRPKPPVQRTDQRFQRSTAHGQQVLDQKEAARKGYVCDEPDCKGQRRYRKTENSEEDKVPSIAIGTVLSLSPKLNDQVVALREVWVIDKAVQGQK